MGARNAKPIGNSEIKAFFNFMKTFKETHPHLNHKALKREGISAWGKLTAKEKMLFAVKPRETPKSKQKKKKAVARSKAKKRAVYKLKPQATPSLNCGFVNFLRQYRKSNTELTTKKSVESGTQVWVSLSKEFQKKYRNGMVRISKICI
ncbi:hypothetical protein KR018_006851, partial [Drosophila ironensis]